MKLILLLVLVLTTVQDLWSQTIPSSCTAPSTIIKNRYQDDADFLAWQNMVNQLNSPFRDSIIIRQGASDTMMNALMAVYNTRKKLAAADTIISMFYIHDHNAKDLHYLSFEADTSEPFMRQLKNNIVPTGYADFDNLLTNYSLRQLIHTPGTTHNPHHYRRETLYSDTSYNMPALGKKFLALTGVLRVSMLVNSGDGSHITHLLTPTYIELRYTHGWSTCYNGCDSSRTWTFRVDYNCNVTYVGSSGHQIKFPSTGIPIVKGEHTTIYPNPATTSLHIDNPQGKFFKYEVYNLLGSRLLLGSASGEIDISAIPKGSYFIRLQHEGGAIVEQFIKQ